MSRATPAAPPARKVLLAVTGMTPQVVTETLYALAVAQPQPWRPDEIHLITTRAGSEHTRLNLLAGPAWFQRLCADYGLDAAVFDADRIQVLHDAHGQPLDDIRTPAENVAAADFITAAVRRFTESPHTELHVSIAGGRKTMGYYLGYALSLFGRAQDRLSHVLVSEPFETNREFYYPTPYDHPIHSRQGNREVTVNARDARVDLAEIPFVRLRDGLPERLTNGSAPFSHVVAVANRAQHPPLLAFDLPTHKVWADGEPLALGKVGFAVLYWLAWRAHSKKPAVDWGTVEAKREFMTLARRVMPSASGEYERMEAAFREHRDLAIRQAKYFEPHKTRINNAFTTLLGRHAAQRYAIQRIRAAQGYHYQLPLAPQEIVIQG